MSFVFIIFLCFLFLSGLILLLGSISQYTSYVETSGQIIDALKCNPSEEEKQTKKKKGAEAVVVAYTVGGKTYHLATNYKRKVKELVPFAQVRILYNPYFPGESRIKEGTPFLGSILVAASFIGLVLLIVFS